VEPPDVLEKRVRFGCGFLAGCVLALTSSFIWTIYNGYYFAAFCLGCAALCGYGAMKLGDRFWTEWWWLWW
jgi:hypothetical protein